MTSTVEPDLAWKAYQTVKSGAALLDHSPWGRLELTGAESLEFLHNQSTNDIKSLQIGQGCETVFMTATAQILDLTTVYRCEQRLWILTSPERRRSLHNHLALLARFLRGATLTDLSDSSRSFQLIGPQSEEILKTLGVTSIPLQTHAHSQTTIAGVVVEIAAGVGLLDPGFTLLVESRDQAATVVAALTAAGAIPIPETTWFDLTLEQGRPIAEFELIDLYNPLEAGLWRAISLQKGCYVGQEVLAKQVTYHRIRQTLWALQLEASVAPGTDVFYENTKIGVLTRSAQTPAGFLGLAYIRTKVEAEPGWQVTLQGVAGKLLPAPLCTYPDP